MIEAYGEPDYAVDTYTNNPEATSLYYHFTVIYLDQGFLLSTKLSGPPDINAELLLGNLQFFVPGIDNYLFAFPVVADKKLFVPWEGFKDFRLYCRQANGPEHQVEDCRGIPGFGKP